MSKNIDQVFVANPINSNASTDLMYFGQSPYGAGNDAAMTYANFSAQFGTPYTAAALTKTDDTNVTLTLGGTPSTALLHAASITAGWTGTLSGTRGGTGVNNGASTMTIGGNFAMSGAFTYTGTVTGNTAVTFPTSGTLATTSQLPSAAALTRTDDTNVTLTLGGTPATALLQATSITAGWSGTLSGTRGGTGVNNGSSTMTIGGNFAMSGAFTYTGTITGNTAVTFPTSGTLATTSQLPSAAALSKVDDTNVTLTLGGTPTTALLQATSITAGWTGTLGVTRGGTGLGSATAYAVLCGGTTSTGALQPVASVGTSGWVLTSNGAGALPTFQAAGGGGPLTATGTNSAKGGELCTATGTDSIAYGYSNNMNGSSQSASFGANNYHYTNTPNSFTFGYNNTVSAEAAICLGESCTAAGICTVAAGTGAQATHDGSFVWGDQINSNTGDSAANQFVVNAHGGQYLYSGSLNIKTAGKGLAIAEGSNAKMGTSVLSGGTVTVTNTSVTANSRIFLTIDVAGGTLGTVYVSAKTASTSFVITSTSAIDTSTVAWMIVEPA